MKTKRGRNRTREQMTSGPIDRYISSSPKPPIKRAKITHTSHQQSLRRAPSTNNFNNSNQSHAQQPTPKSAFFPYKFQ